jgi:DNA repair exonuclease SbcCD ATPase subunit
MEGADSIVIEVDDAPQPAVVTKAPVVSVGVTPAAPAPASRPPKLPEAKRILVDPFAASAAAPAPETPVAEEVSEVTRVEDGGVEIIEVTEDSPSAAPLDFKGQMDAIRGQLDDLRQQWQAIKANIATAHANRRTNQEKIDAQREVIATIEQRKPDIAQIGSRRAAIIRKFEEEELEIQNECAENIKLVQSDRETVEAFEKDADQRICAARLRMTDALSEIDKGSPLVVRIKQIEESISQLEAYDSELQTYIDTQETTLTGIRNQVTSLSSQKDRLRLDEERRIEEERAQALEAVQQEADALDPFFSEIS